MSTEIITIQGQHEVDIDAQEKLVGYEPAELTVETFAGGVRGKMFRINTHQRGDAPSRPSNSLVTKWRNCSRRFGTN